MTFKVTFYDNDIPDIQVVAHFQAERGEVISSARSLCLELFNTTEGIKAKIEKI